MNEPHDLNGALAGNIHRLAERQRRVESKAPWSDRLAGMIASVEAIFLSIFVRISQNRTAAQAQARADLDLHINLLAEHEFSRPTALVRQVTERVGVEPPDDIAEIERDMRAEDVLDTLDRVTPAPPDA